MLRCFQDQGVSRIFLSARERILVTTARGREVKVGGLKQCWQLPMQWRDAKSLGEEEGELEIRRKVETLRKTREAVRRKLADSDDDDLRGWHWC